MIMQPSQVHMIIEVAYLAAGFLMRPEKKDMSLSLSMLAASAPFTGGVVAASVSVVLLVSRSYVKN